MANNNFSYYDFIISQPFNGNLNANTDDTKMKRAVVKMGDAVGESGALQMTGAGTKVILAVRNPTTISRRCFTGDDIPGDKVDDVPDSSYLRGLDALEVVDGELEVKDNFVQRWWKGLLFLNLYLGKNKKDPQGFFEQLVGLDVPKHKMKMIKSCIIGSGWSHKSIPAGLLLYGPPGTGKASLARAFAREVNASFLPVAGEKLAANEKGASRLTSLFTEARLQAPSVIFIDGLESVKAVTDLISQIDKCEADRARVMVVATTENTTKLKKKLHKKFPKSFCTEMPDLETRERMADVLLKDVKVDEEEKKTICQFLAYESDGLVWVDLERVCIEAGVLAKYEGRSLVTLKHISESLKEVKANISLTEPDKGKKQKAKKKAKKVQKEMEGSTSGSKVQKEMDGSTSGSTSESTSGSTAEANNDKSEVDTLETF